MNIAESAPAQTEIHQPFPNPAERAERLIPMDRNFTWAEVEGIPARDGHPGLGFKGASGFTEHTVGGTIVLRQDKEGYELTLISKEGEKLGRPFSRKSLPEVTGGDDSQVFDALQVRYVPGETPHEITGIIGRQRQVVRGSYGGPGSTTATDAELFFNAGLKALEMSQRRDLSQR